MKTPNPGPTTGAPRWVKVFGIIAVALVVLIGAVLLFGGGDHGPGRHTGQSPPGRVTEAGGVDGHQAPAGGHSQP